MANRSKKRMKNKLQILVLCIAALLILTVGGTLAYLAAKTKEVKNEFEPSFVTSQVNVNETDTTVDVTNTGDIDAYIRAAIVVNWMDDAGKVRGVAPASSEYTLNINSTGWKYDETTGFYYYLSKVAPKGTTKDLVTSVEVKGTAPEGFELSVEVVAEAIQADGDTDDTSVSAVQDAWGVTLYGN